MVALTLQHVRARIAALWPYHAHNVTAEGGQLDVPRQTFTIRASTLNWLLDLVGAPDEPAAPLTMAYGRLRIAVDELAVAARRMDEPVFDAAIAKVRAARGDAFAAALEAIGEKGRGPCGL